MDKPQRDILIIKKPSFIVSLLEDTFTFGGFIVLLWFNHTHLAGNGWLDVLFIVGWIMTVAAVKSRRNRLFDNTSDAINWLKESE